jgi:hypothetical protein
MLSELHSLNLKLCSKHYNKDFVLHLIVVPQLSSGWWHNYSTKTRQVGWANEQSMYSLMPMGRTTASWVSSTFSGQIRSKNWKLPNAKCQMPNAKCQMPNAKCQMPNAKCHEFCHKKVKTFSAEATTLKILLKST